MKRKDNLCVKNKIKAKITVLDGRRPEDASMPNTWQKNKGVCGRWSKDVRVRCGGKDNYKCKKQKYSTILNGRQPDRSHEL